MFKYTTLYIPSFDNQEYRQKCKTLLNQWIFTSGNEWTKHKKHHILYAMIISGIYAECTECFNYNYYLWHEILHFV